MSLDTLSQRSAIPSSVSTYGYAKHPSTQKRTIYTGQTLPRFLKDQGADPNSYRDFLKLSKIGSVFDELTSGREVVIPQQNTFARHPEA
jgi:hypothetical protein